MPRATPGTPTKDVGRKFTADGGFRRFPGNTITKSAGIRPATAGNGDGVRWPSDAAWGAPLADVTAQFARKLAGFDTKLAAPIRVAVVGRTKNGIGLRLAAAEEVELRGVRDRLAEVLAIRSAKHATYEFHLSLAYILLHLSEDQKRKVEETVDRFIPLMGDTFELDPPGFCVFDDMSEFRPLLVLKSAEVV
ncbi:RNA ligase/cyclic nucleotide phosphodiesterase [Zopfochytrium polystomum]|nr:RNA ligase/cyclic nucleotide phosphodiesterase [Zopfochytrium polystomum]